MLRTGRVRKGEIDSRVSNMYRQAADMESIKTTEVRFNISRNLCTRKQELMPLRKRSVQLTCVSAEFDPHLKPPNPTATEQLWCNLLALNKPCPFLLLFPDIKKVWHDHLYPKFLHPVNLHYWSTSERTKYYPCLHCSYSRHRYTY